ncbi:MAG: tetratricopeptide repeat protein [Candidatus Krumholzibacteriales bacterium]
MKIYLLKSVAAAVLLMLPLHSAVTMPYALWKIQQKIAEMEYRDAESELAAMIPGLKGKELMWGKLLSARLETDSGRASGIYRDIVSEGGVVSSIARLELAKIYYASERYEDSAGLLGVIPDARDSKVRLESLFFRGLSYKLLGEIYRAREDFKLIDRGKYLYPAYMELAELDMQTGNYTGAAERYEAIGGIHSNPVAIFKLGVCYEILGDNGKALKAYNSLINNYPHSLEAPKAKARTSNLRPDAGRNHSGNERTREPETTGTDPFFTLQFGAFQEKANAEKLYRAISGIFPETRIENAFSDSGSEIFRVRSGRYGQRRKAERDSVTAERKYGYKSRVLTIH